MMLARQQVEEIKRMIGMQSELLEGIDITDVNDQDVSEEDRVLLRQ